MDDNKNLTFAEMVKNGGYLCNCGQLFPYHEQRTLHMCSCGVVRDHELGYEVLKKFPRDK